MEQERVEANLFSGETMKEDAGFWRRSQGNDVLRLILRLAPVVRGVAYATLGVSTTPDFMDSPSFVNAAGF